MRPIDFLRALKERLVLSNEIVLEILSQLCSRLLREPATELDRIYDLIRYLIALRFAYHSTFAPEEVVNAFRPIIQTR
jgi:hypothetical protein